MAVNGQSAITIEEIYSTRFSNNPKTFASELLANLGTTCIVMPSAVPNQPHRMVLLVPKGFNFPYQQIIGSIFY